MQMQLRENFVYLMMVVGTVILVSSCSSTKVDMESIDSDDPFELQDLHKDEYQHLGKVIKSSEFDFIRYDVAECNCSILIPDNHTIKKIVHTGGGVSYVGFIDLGMYALTLTPIDDGVNSSVGSASDGDVDRKTIAKQKSIDDVFMEDLQKMRALKDKIILYSDFDLHGYELKEISTIINSKADIKNYSVQRFAVDNGLLHRIEFFGILHDDITYSYAERFLNSLKKNI